MTTGVTAQPPRWPTSVGGPFSRVPRTSLLELMTPALRAGGPRPLVIFDDGVALTCADFATAVERLAGGLAPHLSPGDRVGLAVGNRAEFDIAFFAILANRAVAVLLGPGLGDAEAEYLVADSGMRLAIAEAGAAAVLERAGGADLTVWQVGDLSVEPRGLAAFESDDIVALESVHAPADEVIDVAYTSGTTGLPKGMEFTHEDLLRYVDIVLRTLPVGPGHRWLCPLHFHYGDPQWLLLVSLLCGEPLVAMRKFSVSRFWNVVQRFEVTAILSIGAIPSLLLRGQPSPAERDHRVELAMAVGVPASDHATLVERFGFPWIEYYGMSETGPALAMPIASADHYVGTGALGIPLPEMEVRLVDESRTELVGAASGELEVTGDLIPFHAYIGNPEATAEILDGGWIRTGDLMRRDDLGVYYFTGRRKEIIRRGGENVAPAQVEAALRSHPEVVDVAAVPVADPLWGEEIKAYVQVSGPVTPHELAAHCATRLAAFKVPRYFEVREEPFPRTASHRIRKHDLMVDGAHQTSTAWDRMASDE